MFPEDTFVPDSILPEIKDLYVDCPECASISDDQYSCCTCNGQGQGGKINVFQWLSENPKYLDSKANKINKELFDALKSLTELVAAAEHDLWIEHSGSNAALKNAEKFKS